MGAIYFWFLEITGLTLNNDELSREYNKSVTFLWIEYNSLHYEDEVLVSVN